MSDFVLIANHVIKSSMFEFEIKNQEGKARCGVFKTPHGNIETPIFMPVGTLGSVKSVSADELEAIGSQIILANTYHLFLRPGEQLIKAMGGLHKWSAWNKPILTDSGGYQVFSLGEGNKAGESNVKIKADGVEFRSHLDGSKHFFTPEKVIEIEHALGADIIMQLDECAPHDSEKNYARQAMERTYKWAQQSVKHHQKLEQHKNAQTPPQALFPIIQGTIHDDLRAEATKQIASLDTPGIAIGGLSVGEERATMYHILDVIEPHLPYKKPRYLMGVGTPIDLLESIERGVDMFDCVHATRIARHGSFYNSEGRQNIKNAKYFSDPLPLDQEYSHPLTEKYSRSYLHHLIKEGEMLGLRILSIHNLHFLLKLMEKARAHILASTYSQFKKDFLNKFKSSV